MAAAQVNNLCETLAQTTNFAQTANDLLKSSYLCINGHNYQIVEIEFYLKSREHNDTFTHCCQEQSTCGQWYFHKQNGKSYKGGTFKGLDLTFGTPVSHGGILIRSIADVATRELIEGPCNVVNKILELAGHEKIIDMVNDPAFSNEAFANGCLLCIVPMDEPREETIVRGSRVGLTLKIFDEFKPGYIMAPYRYYSMANKIKKYKTVAILQKLIDCSGNEDEIANIPGIFGITQRKFDDLRATYDQELLATNEIEHFKGKNLKAGDLIGMFAIVNRHD